MSRASMRTFISSSAESAAAAALAANWSGFAARLGLLDEALEGPVAALLDLRGDPGERRQRPELATAATGELEGRDVVLHAVVVGGQGRGPQQVDRAVRADQAAAGEVPGPPTGQ